ncbi:MAG: hypothetical protein LBB38_02315 [Puniceicoccales bacterium]|nr:hypothetical protein [Puniceicoccales bacterium]
MADDQSGRRRASSTRKTVLVVAGGFVALALALGIFAIRRSIRKSQDERFFREIMLMQEALEQYANQSGRGEPSYTTLRHADVHDDVSKTPISGKWRIRHSGKGKNRASTEIIVEQPDRTLKQMEKIDATVDDGNLATGNFRLVAPDDYAIKLLDSDPTDSDSSGSDGASTAKTKRGTK